MSMKVDSWIEYLHGDCFVTHAEAESIADALQAQKDTLASEENRITILQQAHDLCLEEVRNCLAEIFRLKERNRILLDGLQEVASWDGILQEERIAVVQTYIDAAKQPPEEKSP